MFFLRYGSPRPFQPKKSPTQSSSDAQTGLGFPPERFPPSLPPNLPQHPAGSVSVLDTIRPRRLLPSDPLGAAAAGTSAPPLFAASQSSSDAQTGLGFPSERFPPSLPPNLPQHLAGSVNVLDTIHTPLRSLSPFAPVAPDPASAALASPTDYRALPPRPLPSLPAKPASPPEFLPHSAICKTK